MTATLTFPALASVAPASPLAPPASLPITDLDRTIMRRAMVQARLAASRGERPVGAVVYRGAAILGEAHDRCAANADPTAHAEVLALQAAARRLGSWRLEECSLAVTLEPCPMCAGAIINARLGRLIYGALDPAMGCVTTLYQFCHDTRLHPRVTVAGGLFAEECAALMQEAAATGRAEPHRTRPQFARLMG